MPRLGLGLGLAKGSVLYSFFGTIISNFISRVTADGGTFEAQTCLQNYLNSLGQSLYNKASLIITPNAYKAAKIYAIKPTNGSGDLTFSRASARTRRNSSGIIESLANNVPALNYPVSGCPAWLFEPQRTNIFLNSLTPATQTITVVSGSIYTVSVGQGGTAVLSGAGSGTASFGSSVTFTASSTSLTVTISGTPSYCQVELGSFATSAIETTGLQATRVTDSPILSNVYTNNLISASGGTWYIHFINNTSIVPDNTTGLFLGTNSASGFLGDSFNFRAAGPPSGRHKLWKYESGVGTSLFDTTTDTVKIAIKWNGSTVDVFVNGVKEVSAISFTQVALQNLGITSLGRIFNIPQMMLFPAPLS